MAFDHEKMKYRGILQRSLILLFIVPLPAVGQISPVQWQFDVSSSAKQDEVDINITAFIDEPWHIYSQYIADGGPMPTYFQFVRSRDYELIGKVKEESKVVEQFDLTYLIPVKWFEGRAVFRQRIKLKAPSTTISGSIGFMACSKEQCLLPQKKEFSLIVTGNRRGQDGSR